MRLRRSFQSEHVRHARGGLFARPGKCPCNSGFVGSVRRLWSDVMMTLSRLALIAATAFIAAAGCGFGLLWVVELL